MPVYSVITSTFIWFLSIHCCNNTSAITCRRLKEEGRKKGKKEEKNVNSESDFESVHRRRLWLNHAVIVLIVRRPSACHRHTLMHTHTHIFTYRTWRLGKTCIFTWLLFLFSFYNIITFIFLLFIRCWIGWSTQCKLAHELAHRHTQPLAFCLDWILNL